MWKIEIFGQDKEEIKNPENRGKMWYLGRFGCDKEKKILFIDGLFSELTEPWALEVLFLINQNFG